MGDEINVGYMDKLGKRTQDELYDLIEKVEDLKLQKQGEDAEISFFVSLSDRVQAVQNLRENEMKELDSSVTNLKKHLNELQISKFEYENRYLREKEECDRLKETEEILRKELHDTCAVVQSLKEEIDHLSEETKPSKEDVAILERNQSLLRLYKNLTGLKWDYTAPLSNHAGSVFNSVKNYCKYFCYPATEANVERVWDEIESAAHAVWSD
ncbi:hypothetical protein B7P43_G08746 [Cryptotermes secundus]|uniref:Kinetochore protein Spc24 n=1 Tax=Cryptotermes secundus TaxID=105785 RepID=A0A2J7RNQ4_9NEOP|nr:uncharacterized protein LOC111867566 [Cryptotermes secundus]PNF42466.1 hypothetical protein B7P43_G08746 [Cryptotermes secundus]